MSLLQCLLEYLAGYIAESSETKVSRGPSSLAELLHTLLYIPRGPPIELALAYAMRADSPVVVLLTQQAAL